MNNYIQFTRYGPQKNTQIRNKIRESKSCLRAIPLFYTEQSLHLILLTVAQQGASV